MATKKEIRQVIDILLDADPPPIIRESLKTMFIAAARTFSYMEEDDAGVIIDHYEAMDKFLEQLEVISDT